MFALSVETEEIKLEESDVDNLLEVSIKCDKTDTGIKDLVLVLCIRKCFQPESLSEIFQNLRPLLWAHW